VVEAADSDDTVRQHYLVGRHSTNVLSVGWRTTELIGAGQNLDKGVRRWINYYGPPGTIPWLSYVHVLSNTIPRTALADKVVFVGARVITGFTGGKGTDDYRSPYSATTGTKTPGVEMNATAFLNLFRGDWLERLSPLNEFLIVLAAGLLFGIGLNCLGPLTLILVTVGASAATFAAGCLLPWHAQAWFPWAIPAFVQIPIAGMVAFVFQAHRWYGEAHALERRLSAFGAANPARPAAASPMYNQVPSNSPALIRQELHERVTPDLAPTRIINAPAPPPGLVIPDCNLLRQIGKGAYGDVWIATNVLGSYRALKIIYRSKFEENRPYEREFEGIKHFDPISRNHPGLVHVLHVSRNDTNGYFYYLMELADDSTGTAPLNPGVYEARTLGKDLKRRGRFTLDECITLGLSLSDSLAYLHENGLIHRDIKPANIIFVNGRPKLADIGLVTQIGDGATFVGTEGYYPPEGPGSPAADVYSLGKVLYETFTGLSRRDFPELPTFLGANGEGRRIGQFNKILLRACEEDVSRRYASARELHSELLRLNEVRRPFWHLWRRQRPQAASRSF
jgi:hypothetical protein